MRGTVRLYALFLIIANFAADEKRVSFRRFGIGWGDGKGCQHHCEEDRPLNSEIVKPACGDGCGALPTCAPLAVPYVPFQQNNPQKYAQEQALSNGTLFPGLNLPFHVKAEAAALANTALTELQALEFVITELGLYLDTHSDDAEAFAMFRQYVALEQEGRKRYEAMHGPVTREATAGRDSYVWFQDPWPWEYEAGGKQ